MRSATSEMSRDHGSCGKVIEKQARAYFLAHALKLDPLPQKGPVCIVPENTL